ncbi:hypothetical protein [Streptacidiphilus carbonis]|uniref:hypothetical protein n=1 Tax=Streptacidiphilus carbonis TaxID=105422 RepID=UPI001F1A928E|nr:hypothetical protein [Streptacidiphilus carbonis]
MTSEPKPPAKTPSSKPKRAKPYTIGPIPDDVFGSAADKPEPRGPQAPHITPDRRFAALAHNQQLYQVATTVLPDKPDGSSGRPPGFPPYVYLLFAASISIFGSARSTQAHLQRPLYWDIVREGVTACLGTEEAGRLADVGPTSSQWYYYRHKMLDTLPGLREASRDAWIAQAFDVGLLSADGPRGTWIRPHRSQVIHGDGTVMKPPTDQTEAVTVDQETGEIRNHYIDPDASIQTEGGDRQVYGNKFITIATRLASTPHSRMILNLDAVRHRSKQLDPEKLDEAAAAVKMTTEVLAAAPGVKAVTYDTALRGVHRAPLIRQGVVVFTRQHDGIRPHEIVEFSEGKCTHSLYAAAGRVCERRITVDGNTHYAPLPVRELEVRGKEKIRFYHLVEIPCPRGGHVARIRVDETQEDREIEASGQAKKFNRTEHLRQVPPETPAGRRLLGFRQDSESTNSRLDQAFPHGRLPAYGSKAGLLLVIGFAWAQNALTHALHRLRK